jgi:NADPH2:quinone reductase
MKALRFSRYGDPSVLELVRRGDGYPEPHDDEIVVEVRAASINRSDVLNVAGLLAPTQMPRTPGRDFAGVVVEGPARFIGLEVWGAGGDLGIIRDGTHAEYLVIPLSAMCTKPKNLSFAEAAAVGLAYVTAFHGLINTLRLSVGEHILITGVSGSVGMAAVQIAKWMGVKTFGLDRTRHEEWAPELRADIELSSDDDVLAMISEATDGRGVHCVFDTVGAPVYQVCSSALADEGRYLLAGNAGDGGIDAQITIDVEDFYKRQLVLLGINTLHLSVVDGAKILDHLRSGFESGKLLPPAIARTVRLQDARNAYTLQASLGKTVIIMDEHLEVL